MGIMVPLHRLWSIFRKLCGWTRRVIFTSPIPLIADFVESAWMVKLQQLGEQEEFLQLYNLVRLPLLDLDGLMAFGLIQSHHTSYMSLINIE